MGLIDCKKLGLAIVDDFISQEEELRLLEIIDSKKTVGKKRNTLQVDALNIASSEQDIFNCVSL